MHRITSADNKKIKRLKGLDRKKVREAENLFFVEGGKMIKEAMEAGCSIKEIYISEGYNDTEMLNEITALNISVNVLDDRLFGSISDTVTPQGIMAEVFQMNWEFDALCNSGGPFIILDSLADPGNAGTILRTCEAFGFKGIFALKGSADIYNPKTVRSTMGSIFRVPYISAEKDIISVLKNKSVKIYAFSLDGEDIKSFKKSSNCAIVIGNESKGVSEDIKRECDSVIKIPMTGRCESLNASVAAAIAMYEIFTL